MITITPIEQLLDRLRDDICDTLQRSGFSVPDEAKADVFEAGLAIFRVMHRSLPQRPRNVVWSRELQSRALTPDLLSQVKSVEQEARDGADLNPRLTRKFFKASFDDDLLNDLSVHHFHLGEPGRGKKGQTGGSSEILFAFLHQDILYFLDVLPHDAFRTADFLKILETNWPEVFKSYRILELKGSEGPPVTPQERAEARRNGITIISSANGEALMPPGGGVATDGTSTVVVDRAMDLLRTVHLHHDWLLRNADDFTEQLQTASGRTVTSLDLWVRFDQREVYFEDKTLGALIYPGRGSALIPPSDADDAS